MKLVDGLFLNSCRDVAKKFPSIKLEEMIVDNTCMQLVKNPWEFEVMVMPNLYGSIITSIGAGLTGGPGISSGTYIG
jgi:isocitrate dehydrogenase (NAD+)